MHTISLIALLAAGILAVHAAAPGQTCDVGELTKVLGGGLCNDDYGSVNEENCDAHCKKQYGAELVDSQCSDVRANGQRECICKLKCCNQGCWGDPHCWTCDGQTFDYQGLKKYYVMKPCKPYKSIPNFEIRQTNKLFYGGPPAVLNTSELFIPEWNRLLIEIIVPQTQTGQYVMKVNGKEDKVGSRFSNLDSYKENFVKIDYADAPNNKQVVITTSFGLRILISTHPFGDTVYSDISIDTPRHPELKGRVCGLLGHWNDNIDDDLTDANGNKQPKDQYNWAFGNSWIVKEETSYSWCELESLEKECQEKQSKVTEEQKKIIEKICRANLQRKDLEDCAKAMNRPPPSIEDCVLDLMFITDVEQQKHMIKAMIEKYSSTCKTEIKFQEPTCCLKNLAPLYRIYEHKSGDHHYTVNSPELAKCLTGGWAYEATHGLVANGPDGCSCSGSEFIPIYRAWNPSWTDHFFTHDKAEMDNAVKNLGFTYEGIAYYCAKTAGQCGATLPWRRYWRPKEQDHFYTTSEEEGTNNVVKVGGSAEGIMCYIWPVPEQVRQK